MTSVGLVVNTYERTYRDVLVPGFFPGIAAQNRREFDEVTALINNVDDLPDAVSRAQDLVDRGDITRYALVADHIDAALVAARLPRRVLRRRPYLLDYGLVMPHVVSTEWLLGWDAEAHLPEPTNWVDPSIELMTRDARVFHASLSWPAAPDEPGPLGEAWEMDGNWSLNYGFSDQLFLLRRTDLIGPIYRAVAPAAMARHAPHPYTFEFRVESHQRATRRFRASLTTVPYATNDLGISVITRTGRSRMDTVVVRSLRRLEHHIINRLPPGVGPRYRK